MDEARKNAGKVKPLPSVRPGTRRHKQLVGSDTPLEVDFSLKFVVLGSWIVCRSVQKAQSPDGARLYPTVT